MSEVNFLKVNVNEHVERKNNLSYLSWAWAWSEVLKVDPNATWEVVEYDGLPCCYLKGDTAMVKTLVTINGVTKSCILPVMDHKNKSIPEPDSFAINKNIMRCLTKTIGMFGLGLYIYAGEDMPEEDAAPQEEVNPYLTQEQIEKITALRQEVGVEFDALMLWVSKGAKRSILSLKDTPADAYEPIINKLNKSRVVPA